MPVFDQLFICKSKAWILEECVPFVEMSTLILCDISWGTPGLPLVDLNQAVWNCDHRLLISTLLCQSLCPGYRFVDKGLCLPFSLSSFSFSLDFCEWVHEWMREWVNKLGVPEMCRASGWALSSIRTFCDSTGIFCVRVIHTILNVFQYELCYKILNFIFHLN